MRSLVALISILALPTASVAQVSGAGTAAQHNIGTSGANVPLLTGANIWGGANSTGTNGQQRFDLNFGAIGTQNFPIISAVRGDGVVSARSQTMLQIVGVPNLAVSPEVNVVDAFAYNGFAQYDAERYDRGGPNNGAVQNAEPIGGYGVEPFDGVSDATTAGFAGFTTETQSHSPAHHGTGLQFSVTLNGASTYRTPAMCMSPGGLGGVTIGNNGGAWPAECPTDLGTGSLNAQSDVATGGHWRSTGAKPKVTSCGSGRIVDGTDAAGAVETGGSVTSCTILFSKAYASDPICIVQIYANASPVAYLSKYSSTGFVVSWKTAFSGRWFYICQGIS